MMNDIIQFSNFYWAVTDEKFEFTHLHKLFQISQFILINFCTYLEQP